jgi:hypothetical protein
LQQHACILDITKTLLLLSISYAGQLKGLPCLVMLGCAQVRGHGVVVFTSCSHAVSGVSWHSSRLGVIHVMHVSPAASHSQF